MQDKLPNTIPQPGATGRPDWANKNAECQMKLIFLFLVENDEILFELRNSETVNSLVTSNVELAIN